MKSFLKSIAKIVSVLAIVFIVTIAIGISLSPLISKALNDRRPVFEKWVSTYLGIPVTMNEVGFSWYRYYPEISLRKVNIYNQASNQPAIEIQKVSVFFSVPKSIWQRKFVPSGFMVAGTTLNLKKTEAGNITVLGFVPSHGLKSSDGPLVGALAFISTQPYLILKDIGLNYEGPKGTKYHAKLNDLKVVNSNIRHRLSGSLELYQKIPTALTWSVEWRGNKFDLSTIKAKGYVYVTGLSLPQWLSGHEWLGWEINKGIASAKIWGTLSRGRVRKLQSSLKLYDLDLYSQLSKTNKQIHRLSGNIGWKRERKQYVLAGEDILIDLPSRLWPVTDFYIAFARGKNHVLLPKEAHVGYINLNDIAPFLEASPALVPNNIQQMLNALHLEGNLQNTSIKFGDAWKNWQQLDIKTHFNQLSLSSWQNFPSIKNFSGSLKWNGTVGEVSLNSSRSLFQYGRIFANPINIEQLTGKIQFQKDQNQTWKLHVPSLQLLNNDISANMSGGLTVPLAGPTVTDIKANFVLQKADHVAQYLPLKIFSPYLVKWLQEAFLSGEVKDGHLELQGPLNEFPFDHQNGTFLITSKLNNIALHYAPSWPEISKLSGKLTFSGRKILMDINRGEISNIPLTNVHGEIPTLSGAPVLFVESKNIQTDFTKGLTFIHESPLNQTIGKMFAKTELLGPIDLDLSLKVPLSGTAMTEVKGTLGLKDASLNLPQWHINLDELNGKIIFTERTTDAKMMKGSLFNKPITFSLATINKTKDISIVRASFQNRINIEDLEKWSTIPFSTVVSGATSVSGYIDFSQKLPVSMYLQSNLVGVKVDLPDQYSKQANVPKPFTADLTFPENSPWAIHLTYGDLLSASALLQKNNSNYHLMGVNLHFGTGIANLPKEGGLYLSGKFNRLEWDNVKKYIDQANTNDKNGKAHKDNQNNKYDLSALTFRNADIIAETLGVFGQEIKEVHLQASSENNNWNINIASPDIVGQLIVPKVLTQQSTINAQFQKLYLSKAIGNQTNKIDIKSLPSISFKADDVKYNDMPFGEISFNALSNDNKMAIQSLRIVSPRINLQAEGDWVFKGEGTSQTHLKGSARSNRVSELLGSLGLDAHNFVSTKGQLEFNLTWEDAPYFPSLSTLAGQVKINLGPGRIVNVSQSRAQMSLGRMLSIFSLQSIPKRLSLDFSDLFQKGYNFNSATGDFTFENGNAFTKNLRFDGPVASVGIDGRIGLINKDYDLVLNTKTYVTSSLPVVAAASLLTGINPLIGLGALAVNTVIGPEMTTYYYSVKGPWSGPVWQKAR